MKEAHKELTDSTVGLAFVSAIIYASVDFLMRNKYTSVFCSQCPLRLINCLYLLFDYLLVNVNNVIYVTVLFFLINIF